MTDRDTEAALDDILEEFVQKFIEQCRREGLPPDFERFFNRRGQLEAQKMHREHGVNFDEFMQRFMDRCLSREDLPPDVARFFKRWRQQESQKMSDPGPGQFDDAENEDECTKDSPKPKKRKYTPPNKKKNTTDKIKSELERLFGHTDKVLEVFKNRYRKLEKNRNRIKELVEDTQICMEKHVRETEEMTSMRFGKIMENFNSSQEKVNGMKSAIDMEILKINELKNTLAMTRDRVDQIIKEKAAEEIRRLECGIQTSEEMTSMTIAEIIENVNASQGKADGTTSAIDEEILKINELKNTLAMTRDRVDQIIKEKAAEEIRRLECGIQTSEEMTSMTIAEIIENVNNSQGKADGMKSVIDEDIAKIKELQKDLTMTLRTLAQKNKEKAAQEISRLVSEIQTTTEMTSMTITEIIENVNNLQGIAVGTQFVIDEDIAKIKELQNDIAMTREKLAQTIQEKVIKAKSRLECEHQKLREEYKSLNMANKEFKKKIDDMKRRAAEKMRQTDDKIKDLKEGIKKIEKELYDHQKCSINEILGWEEQIIEKKKILDENKKIFQDMKDDFKKEIKYLDQQKDWLKHNIDTMERSFTSHRDQLAKNIQALQQNNEDNKTKIQSLSVTAAQAKGNMEKSTQMIVSIGKRIEMLRTLLDINEEDFGNNDDDESTKRGGRRQCIAPTPSNMVLGQENDDGD